MDIILTSKNSDQNERKVTEFYQSGMGYKAVSKGVGLKKTGVRAVIHKGLHMDQWGPSQEDGRLKLPQRSRNSSSKRYIQRTAGPSVRVRFHAFF